MDAILSFFSYTLLWLHSKRCDLCWAYNLSENKTKTPPQPLTQSIDCGIGVQGLPLSQK